MELKEHEAELLKELRAIGDWVTPREVGGHDGSHHSRTLAKLCKLGFAERDACRGGWIRHAYKYRAVMTPNSGLYGK